MIPVVFFVGADNFFFKYFPYLLDRSNKFLYFNFFSYSHYYACNSLIILYEAIKPQKPR